MANKEKDSKSSDFIQKLEGIIVKVPLKMWTEESTRHEKQTRGPHNYDDHSYGSSDYDDTDGFSDSPPLSFWDRRVFERSEFFTYGVEIDDYVLRLQGCRRYIKVTKGYDESISDPSEFGDVKLTISKPKNLSGVYDTSNNTRIFFIDLFNRYSRYKDLLERRGKKRGERALNKERQNLLTRLEDSVK